jgi:peptidoglycan/LPS O-acetylase OafA/YrhL
MNWYWSNRVIKGPAKLIATSCALLFAGPPILMSMGGHYWWNSRIYLMFLVILLFIGSLAATLYQSRKLYAVAAGGSGGFICTARII